MSARRVNSGFTAAPLDQFDKKPIAEHDECDGPPTERNGWRRRYDKSGATLAQGSERAIEIVDFVGKMVKLDVRFQPRR
jgi:hypothetical protein